MTTHGGNEIRPLHPFFDKRQAPTRSASGQTSEAVDSTADKQPENEPPKTPTDRNDVNFTQIPEDDPSLNGDDVSSNATSIRTRLVLSPSRTQSQNTGPTEKRDQNEEDRFGGELGVEEDPNAERRKRRKTESPSPSPPHFQQNKSPSDSQQMAYADPASDSWIRQLEVAASDGSQEAPASVQTSPTTTPDQSTRNHHDTPSPSKDALPSACPVSGKASRSPEVQLQVKPAIVLPQSSPPSTPPAQEEIPPSAHDPNITSQKKMLKLNQNGKLLSSPPRQSPPGVGRKQTKKTRKSCKSEKSVERQWIVLKYGVDVKSRENTGFKIDAIMSGSERHEPVAKAEPLKPLPPKAAPKATHPFFLGKVAKPNLALALSSTQSASTCSSLQGSDRESSRSPTKRSAFPRDSKNSNRKESSFAFTLPNLGKPKFPQSILPTWPTRDLLHVRGEQADAPCVSDMSSFKAERKAKEGVLDVLQGEDILYKFTQHLSFTDDSHQPALRLPRRELMSARDMQVKVSQQLSCDALKAMVIPDETQGPNLSDVVTCAKQSRIHPAIKHMFASLEDSLTAFDKGQCDTLPWISKYAPQCAEHALYMGPEATMLCDWLGNLVVSNVDKGAPAPKPGGSKEDKSKRKKKRLRKSAEDLDGFVVTSEEEADELDEISGSEDELSRDDGPYRKRTVVRTGDTRKNSRLDGRSSVTNAVLISGPSGCGKTALVHAVANELGFEIFEINPGMRRSGKDIFDKVGDMTQNHLVRQQTEHKAEGLTVDAMSAPDNTDLEIKAGKQGTMNSFLKPKAPASLKRKSSKKSKETPAVEQQKAQNNRKQSLILLEEVDILFEEDKAFWPSVLELLTQSKRPIIMTCNDEELIPLDNLQLHAILRVNAPPVDLAVDYLLLLASNEGHIINRSAVRDLFDVKNRDLRASIQELDFWCQMAIGDCKGGLEWMMDRWPPGIDLDAYGRKLRVTSSDTYVSAMGWFGRDIVVADVESQLHKDLEMLTEAWEFWNIDPLSIPDVENDNQQDRSPTSIDLLRQHETGTENLSVLTALCGQDTQDFKKDDLDPTLPQISDKLLLNMVEGYPFLQSDESGDYSSFTPRMASAIRSLSRPSWISKNTFRERNLSETIKRPKRGPEEASNRAKFSAAFEPIAETPQKFLDTSAIRQSGSFDGPIAVIAEDLAPYIRRIVSTDIRSEEERRELSRLLSRGGKSGKARTTRASRAALEGGDKATTRKERYLPKRTDYNLVLSTGCKDWQDALTAYMQEGTGAQMTSSKTSSASSPGSSAETPGDDL